MTREIPTQIRHWINLKIIHADGEQNLHERYEKIHEIILIIGDWSWVTDRGWLIIGDWLTISIWW